VLIGAGFVVTIWLPLAMVGLWVGGLFAEVATGYLALVTRAGPVVVSFLLACSASGGLVGRFGGAAGVREAVLANGLGSLLILGIAALSGGINLPIGGMALLVLWACSFLCGLLGARWGRRRRSSKQ
jgi:hypothetical protein